MLEDLFDQFLILNKTDDLHLSLVLGTGQEVQFMDLLNQLAQFFLYSLHKPSDSRMQGIHSSFLFLLGNIIIARLIVLEHFTRTLEFF